VSVRVAILVLAASASASAQSLTLDRASIWAGAVFVSRKGYGPQVTSSSQTMMAGVEGNFSALGRVLPAIGGVQVGDLFGVSIGGGNDGASSDSGKVLGSLFDARAGAQALYRSGDFDAGVQAGACLCGDHFTPASRDIGAFVGARLRFGKLAFESEVNEWGVTAALSYFLPKFRAGAMAIVPFKETDETFVPAATTSGFGARLFVGIDL
jgi:hypothetical protein